MSYVVCDQEKCSGCLACIVACMDQHYDEEQTNAVPMRIYEKKVSERTGLVSYITRSCMHCEHPQCISACRFGALKKNEQGFVIVEIEKCVGCRACEKVCPYQIPRFDKTGKMVKCDGCYGRVACGLEPACVKACNTGALKFL